jgi:energy-coupling factor transporter ATP-binding protein EcfA2
MKPLKIKPIPVPLGNRHPESPNEVLPNHEFTMGIIAPKGSGKTTLMCNILQFYKHYFHTIIIFSPTINNDDKWDFMKTQDLLIENKPLKAWAKKMLEKTQDKNQVVSPPPVNPGNIDINDVAGNGGKKRSKDDKFDGRIPESCFYTEYNEASLIKIFDQQQEMIDMLKANKQPKYLANRIMILFDDMVGSNLFSSARGNFFKKLNSNHRHWSTSIMMVSQGYKEIPKTPRCNWTCIILFEIWNDAELECIYDENPMGMTKDQWMVAYKFATRDDYSFLFYNIQRPRALRLMKNFDEIMFFKE